LGLGVSDGTAVVPIGERMDPVVVLRACQALPIWKLWQVLLTLGVVHLAAVVRMVAFNDLAWCWTVATLFSTVRVRELYRPTEKNVDGVFKALLMGFGLHLAWEARA